MSEADKTQKHVTYISYLKVDELLQLQHQLSGGTSGDGLGDENAPQPPEHDEMLFIIIHQTYELWFKQILHEMSALQPALEAGQSHRALALLGRIRTIMKTCVAQLDILETMTPLQFNSFRSRLESSSGFQSAQFREVEAVLGRRDQAGSTADKSTGMGMAEHLIAGSPARVRVELAMSRPSLWDSALRYFAARGFAAPSEILNRDVTKPYEASLAVQAVLLEMYRTDPEARMVAEWLVDLDEGLQEWRYRHVKMVERTIGRKQGTGGSGGASYLQSTLFHPVFGDLWAIRSQL